jgi:hypothetical protein
VHFAAKPISLSLPPYKFLLIKSLLCTLGATPLAAQNSSLDLLSKKLPKTDPPDQAYVGDYHKDLTIRMFAGRRFYHYGLYDKGFGENVRYTPNTPLSIGAGFNYRVLGLNIGFSPDFLNNTHKYGQTGFLDLQTHLYGRKLTMDLAFLHYRGFYLRDNAFTGNDPAEVYIRPDLRFNHFGFSAQYLANGERFSLRAAFLQNEAQLRSAGSFLLGGGFSLFGVGADSAIVPKGPQTNYFDNLNFSKSTVISGLIHAGYGYTYVYRKHFFATVAATAGVGINQTKLKSKPGSSLSGWGTDAVTTLRMAIGYNTRLYFAGIHYQGSWQSSGSPIIYARQQYGMGNWRLSLARRLVLKKKLLGFY